MDSSKEYIEMCRKANEIQALVKPKNNIPGMLNDGDVYWWSVDNKIHISYTDLTHHPEQWDYISGREVVWLPRLDQLQELIEEDINPLTKKKGLMVVMNKLYSKKWDGLNWIY